jgi:hypothetical protein
MENWCETTRVPGSMARMRWRTQRLSWGRRYMVTTVARRKSS